MSIDFERLAEKICNHLKIAMEWTSDAHRVERLDLVVEELTPNSNAEFPTARKALWFISKYLLYTAADPSRYDHYAGYSRWQICKQFLDDIIDKNKILMIGEVHVSKQALFPDVSSLEELEIWCDVRS